MFEHLLNRFSWRPEPHEFLSPLRIERSIDPGISRFAKGIDNTRIDVALSPRFMHHAHLWARQELTRHTSTGGAKPSSVHDENHLAACKSAYIGMMRAAVDSAQRRTRPGMVPLLQFGVIKFLLQLIDREIERLQGRMQQSREANKQHYNERSVEIHERLVSFSKEGDALRYRVVRTLFREILKLEEMSLSKDRQAALTVAWPVPKEALFNPLLQLPSIWADELWMKHYPLALSDWQGEQAPLFARFNALVIELFRDYLPGDMLPEPQHNGGDAAGRRRPKRRQYRQSGSESLPGLQEVTGLLEAALRQNEYQQDRRSWLDAPANVDLIIKSVAPPRQMRIDSEDEKRFNPWELALWPKFHRHLLKRYFTAVKKAHLGMLISASYATPQLYRQLDGRLPARIIYQYLGYRTSRRTLQRRLRAMQPALDVERSMQRLDEAARQLRRRQSANVSQRHMLRFLVDFVHLRRDLKQAYRAYQSMEGIRVLTRAADLELSRGNSMLNEFVLADERRPEQRRIRSHVVLKADVRGSTEMVRELRKRELNPASHFSRNFFEPINDLLARYGAKKIFVEGDAVILSLYEYEDKHYRWLCVSLACGLASDILRVVDERNLECRENGLPELEVGLGVAFLDEAPTFLVDQEREIMISAAINRADQLSSCSALLRKSEFGRGLGRGVEVVAASGLPILEKESSDRMMRYNVNGIELDTPAFLKLQTELALRVVRLDEELYPGGSRFYVGKYADLKGNKHWLVVREAPVRVWNGGKAGEGEQYGHRFYQVVAEPEAIKRITESDTPVSGQVASSEEQETPPPTEMHFGF